MWGQKANTSKGQIRALCLHRGGYPGWGPGTRQISPETGQKGKNLGPTTCRGSERELEM